MSVLRAVRPISGMWVGLLFLLLLFIGFRSCHSARLSRAGLSGSSYLPSLKAPDAGGVGIATIPFSHTPRYVQRVVDHLRRVKHWQPLRGFKGGRRFDNFNGTLPNGRVYYEYDVHPLRTGFGRGTERLVVDETKTFFYYTKDHYNSFIQILLP